MASGTTLIRLIIFCADCRISSSTRPRRYLSKSSARTAVPSIPAPLVRMIASPGIAPPVVTYLSFSASPIMKPMRIGLSSPGVVSVCPPIRLTPTSMQAAWICSMIPSRSSSPAPSGSSVTHRNHKGLAPVEATSLALMWTANHPTLPTAPVIGSVATTSTLSPLSITAASSPTWGPWSSRSQGTPSLSKTTRLKMSEGTFPVGKRRTRTMLDLTYRFWIGDIGFPETWGLQSEKAQELLEALDDRDTGTLPRLVDA